MGSTTPSGDIVDMEGSEKGESINGINEWYFRTNTNGVKQYYWGGGVDKIQDEQTAELPVNWRRPLECLNNKFTKRVLQFAGRNVKIAVIDSGVFSGHKDLQGACLVF